MTWFKVDDGFAHHHKAVNAGNAALGLWVRAGSWASFHLTDGYVPGAIVATMGTAAQALRLVKAGLWVERDDGYQFHDWSAFNPSSSETAARRKQAAERQRASRERRGEIPSREKEFRSEEKISKTTRSLGNSEFPETPRSEAPVTRDSHVSHASVTRDSGSGRVVVVTTTTKEEAPTGKQPDLASTTVKRGKPRTPYDYRTDEAFARFWDTFPERSGKAAAYGAWQKALARGANPDLIIAAAGRYANDLRRDPRKTKYPQGWLNDERYLDELPQQQLEWWDTA